MNFGSRMAGDSHVDESKLKGLSKIFNGETIKGRANVSEIKFVIMLCNRYLSFCALTGSQGDVRRYWLDHPVLHVEAIEEVNGDSPFGEMIH